MGPASIQMRPPFEEIWYMSFNYRVNSAQLLLVKHRCAGAQYYIKQIAFALKHDKISTIFSQLHICSNNSRLEIYIFL